MLDKNLEGWKGSLPVHIPADRGLPKTLSAGAAAPSRKSSTSSTPDSSTSSSPESSLSLPESPLPLSPINATLPHRSSVHISVWGCNGNVGKSTTSLLPMLASKFPNQDIKATVWARKYDEFLSKSRRTQAANHLQIKDVYELNDSDLDHSDVIVVTAGLSAVTTGSKSRDAALCANIEMLLSFAPAVRRIADARANEGTKPPLVLLVCNPVDALTALFAKMTGLPSEYILGIGPNIDEMRLRTHIADALVKKGALPIDQPMRYVELKVGGNHNEFMHLFPDSVKITLPNGKPYYYNDLKNPESPVYLQDLDNILKKWKSFGTDFARERKETDTGTTAANIIDVVENYIRGTHERSEEEKKEQPSAALSACLTRQEAYYGDVPSVVGVAAAARVIFTKNGPQIAHPKDSEITKQDGGYLKRAAAKQLDLLENFLGDKSLSEKLSPEEWQAIVNEGVKEMREIEKVKQEREEMASRLRAAEKAAEEARAAAAKAAQDAKIAAEKATEEARAAAEKEKLSLAKKLGKEKKEKKEKERQVEEKSRQVEEKSRQVEELQRKLAEEEQEKAIYQAALAQALKSKPAAAAPVAPAVTQKEAAAPVALAVTQKEEDSIQNKSYPRYRVHLQPNGATEKVQAIVSLRRDDNGGYSLAIEKFRDQRVGLLMRKLSSKSSSENDVSNQADTQSFVAKLVSESLRNNQAFKQAVNENLKISRRYQEGNHSPRLKTESNLSEGDFKNVLSSWGERIERGGSSPTKDGSPSTAKRI